MSEKTIGNFGNDLLEFLEGELREQFPENLQSALMTNLISVQLLKV